MVLLFLQTINRHFSQIGSNHLGINTSFISSQLHKSKIQFTFISLENFISEVFRAA